MAPKVKITKEDLIRTAVELVREQGEQSINARTLATVLGCSTQPIFSNFTNMGRLKESVIRSVYDVYLDFIKNEVESKKYPEYKAFGMAYIRFAKEEKEFFKLLFMRDRTGEDLSPSPDFDTSVEMIMKSCGLSMEKAKLMHLEMWSCVHGIGVMAATSFLPLEWELISRMISDVYQGIKARLLSEETAE